MDQVEAPWAPQAPQPQAQHGQRWFIDPHGMWVNVQEDPQNPPAARADAWGFHGQEDPQGAAAAAHPEDPRAPRGDAWQQAREEPQGIELLRHIHQPRGGRRDDYDTYLEQLREQVHWANRDENGPLIRYHTEHLETLWEKMDGLLDNLDDPEGPAWLTLRHNNTLYQWQAIIEGEEFLNLDEWVIKKFVKMMLLWQDNTGPGGPSYIPYQEGCRILAHMLKDTDGETSWQQDNPSAYLNNTIGMTLKALGDEWDAWNSEGARPSVIKGKGKGKGKVKGMGVDLNLPRGPLRGIR